VLQLRALPHRRDPYECALRYMERKGSHKAPRAQQSLQNRPDVDTRDILEATSHKGIRGPSGKRLEGPQSDGVSWA